MESDRPRCAAPIIENIPDELKQRPQWVAWRYEWVVNKQNVGKWTKVPYGARDYKASHSRPSSWQAFHSAYALYLRNQNHFDGIGYVFSEDDPYVGGDRDHCVKDGVIDPDVLALIPFTYAEVSPSGEGVKFIARASGHYGRKTVKGELYNSLRFFTITGRVMEGRTQITACQEAVDAFLASLGGIERKNSTYNSNGSRSQLAAAIPAEDWAEGRRLLRDELSQLLARLRASTAPTTQLGYVLREDFHGLHTQYPRAGAVRGDGSIDSSQIRAIFASGMRMRRFTFPEFVALFYHFYGADCLAKWGTTQGFREEAATLWAKARMARPGEQLPTAPAPQGTLLERVYQTLLNYKAGISAIFTLDDIAADLGIHKGTVSKLIKALVTDKRITTRRYGSHGGLVAEFPPELITGNEKPRTNAENGGNPSAKILEGENEAELIYEIAINDVDALNFDTPSAKFLENDTDYELISAEAESAPECGNELTALRKEEPPYISNTLIINPVSLPGFGNSQKRVNELARDYLDQPAVLVGERLVNEGTGVVTYRRTAQHFAQLVKAEYPEADAIAAYKAEQERRRQEEADAWERFFASLRRMTNDELIAYIRGGCRRAVAELAREGGTFDQHLYKTRLDCAKRHLGWRGLDMPTTAQKPIQPRVKKQQVVKPEQQTLELVPSISLPTVNGMIERIKALKQDTS